MCVCGRVCWLVPCSKGSILTSLGGGGDDDFLETRLHTIPRMELLNEGGDQICTIQDERICLQPSGWMYEPVQPRSIVSTLYHPRNFKYKYMYIQPSRSLGRTLQSAQLRLAFDGFSIAPIGYKRTNYFSRGAIFPPFNLGEDWTKWEQPFSKGRSNATTP